MIVGAAIASCGSGGVDPDTDPTLRILFIGNSLTYANDLPGTVQRLGQSDHTRSVVVSSVAVGNASLEDHWNRGDAQRAIASARWDLVVLQQGPSAPCAPARPQFPCSSPTVSIRPWPAPTGRHW